MSGRLAAKYTNITLHHETRRSQFRHHLQSTKIVLSMASFHFGSMITKKGVRFLRVLLIVL